MTAEEVLDSKIFKRAKAGSSVVHSDGARAYETVMKQNFKKLKHRAVAHKSMEFVRKVRAVRLASGLSATSTGTQAIDSTWKTLSQNIPKELSTKKAHGEHPLIRDYAWSWLYRVNHRNVDGFTTLGRYVKRAHRD